MQTSTPLAAFRIDAASIAFVGTDLERPESVLPRRDGSIVTCDKRGVMTIDPDGRQTLIAPSRPQAATDAKAIESDYLPNGVEREADGSFLLANFGTNRLERLRSDGQTEVVCDHIDGRPVGKVNFVTRDRQGRVWFTVSTRRLSWIDAINDGELCDGYIAVLDANGPRIVAEGLSFANECRLDAAEEHIFVAETRARHITRFTIQPDGSLSDRAVHGPADLGGFPDGIALDAEGNVWGTLIGREQIYAIAPDGGMQILLDLGDRDLADALDRAVLGGRSTAEDFLRCGWPSAGLITSVAFGGDDLKTVYIGSLAGTSVPWFRSPIAGLPLASW